QVGQHGRRRFVHGLEQPATEHTMVDHWAPGEQRHAEIAVDPSDPLRLAEHVKAEWMLEVELRFGFAVTHLLLEIRLDGVAAEMPHHGGRAEANGVPAVLQPPTEVDVISGSAVNGVEAADLIERRLEEGHVATGNVFGHLVFYEHVRRTA